MSSLPDIFKQQGTSLSGEKVVIPDVPIYYPPEPLPEPEEDVLPPDDGEEAVWEPGTEAELEPYYEPEPEPVQIPMFTPVVMTREELTEYYREDLEQLRQEAAQRGYAEAFSRKKGELNRYLDQVDQTLSDMQQQQTQYMEHFAKELKYMALEIAEKMICMKLDQNDEILSKLVLQVVASVKTASWIEVELSERLVSLVECIQHELERPEYHGRGIVVSRATADDTVRVTTEDGTIVATISTQAQNLREAFESGAHS